MSRTLIDDAVELVAVERMRTPQRRDSGGYAMARRTRLTVLRAATSPKAGDGCCHRAAECVAAMLASRGLSVPLLRLSVGAQHCSPGDFNCERSKPARAAAAALPRRGTRRRDSPSRGRQVPARPRRARAPAQLRASGVTLRASSAPRARWSWSGQSRRRRPPAAAPPAAAPVACCRSAPAALARGHTSSVARATSRAGSGREGGRGPGPRSQPIL
eukprot:scaffold1707_cov357-Prasinococcus_capsulatus_cf.AAC.12